MKLDIKSFSKLEELRAPMKSAQSLLARHISRSRLILDIALTSEQEESSGQAFYDLLESVKGLFLWDRFRSVGIYTLVDLKHLAGLTTLWEYRDLLAVGMGIFRFGRNWSFMTTFLYRVRKEEEATLGRLYTPPILQAGLYRDKYRSLNDTLWRPKVRKSPKMVDLDSDVEENSTKVVELPQDGSAESQELQPSAPRIPREVILARAANMLDLPRFR